MRWIVITCMVAWAMSAGPMAAAADPAETVRQSEQVLAEAMAIPAREIPIRLLAEAEGVAIIPRVIKIGFVAGGRRGQGVVFVRDAANREWSMPQFVTLTGGSVGWQAGVQATDVVLVFTTRKGVEDLMKGKFTVGADASVSAGPVGREAAAATDTALKAEILSYSRSRGLFLGVSIQGSALEIDQASAAAFYGPQTAQRVPESANQLRNYLTQLTTAVATAPQATAVQPELSAKRLDALRRTVSQNTAQLHGVLPADWRMYLALPKEFSQPAGHPSVDSLTAVEQRFAKVNSSPAYKQLAQRPEFQTAYEALREYRAALSEAQPAQPGLQLPPPPAQ